MAQKNILLLIPNLDFGGAQRSFSKLSLELAKEYNVFVGVFNTYEGIAYPFGGTLLDLKIPGSSAFFGKALNFYKRIAHVKKIKKDYKIDVAISFLEGADYVNLLSKHTEKTIISIRGSKLFDGEINGLAGWVRMHILMPYLYQKADKVVAVSNGIREEMISTFHLRPTQVNTIYNFYEIEAIQQMAAESLGEPVAQALLDKPVIINSGRLHTQKAQAPLIEIFAQLVKFKPLKLVILGDGPLRNQLIDLANSLSLKTYHPWGNNALHSDFDVYFLGYQENPFKFISKSTLFAFTSSWEGFPNALAEAMVCQVPVISTDCPTGPREILAPDTDSNNYTTSNSEFAPYGILMPLLRENYDAELTVWVSTLLTLLNNTPTLNEYKEASSNRMESFTTAAIYKEWKKIIEDIIK